MRRRAWPRRSGRSTGRAPSRPCAPLEPVASHPDAARSATRQRWARLGRRWCRSGWWRSWWRRSRWRRRGRGRSRWWRGRWGRSRWWRRGRGSSGRGLWRGRGRGLGFRLRRWPRRLRRRRALHGSRSVGGVSGLGRLRSLAGGLGRGRSRLARQADAVAQQAGAALLVADADLVDRPAQGRRSRGRRSRGVVLGLVHAVTVDAQVARAAPGVVGARRAWPPAPRRLGRGRVRGQHRHDRRHHHCAHAHVAQQATPRHAILPRRVRSGHQETDPLELVERGERDRGCEAVGFQGRDQVARGPFPVAHAPHTRRGLVERVDGVRGEVIHHGFAAHVVREHL